MFSNIPNEGKKRGKNLTMAWTDNKKAYDMVPQNWIIDSLKMNKISDKVYRENHEKLGELSWQQ